MSSNFELQELAVLVQEALDGGDGDKALLVLQAENQRLQETFERDPMWAVTGELFDAAEVLDRVAQTLAGHFAKLNKDEQEERAWQLRFEPIRTAHPHRRNVVGPALLDWAHCNKRIGNLEKAEELYGRIVKDFVEILPWGPTFNSEWILAVTCLQEAVEHSTLDHGDLGLRVSAVLKKSHEMRVLDQRRNTAEALAHHQL